MRCVSIYLEDEKIKQLDNIAKSQKRSRANLLYIVIEKYLGENNVK